MRFAVLLLVASLWIVLHGGGGVLTQATKHAASPLLTKTNPGAQTCVVSEPIPEKRLGLTSWYVSADRTIWAHFWSSEPLKSVPQDYKVLWIRPKPFPDASPGEAERLLAAGQVGAEFVVSGRRLDSSAPALKYSVPAVYPQEIQASSVSFPTSGCWQVDAKAGNSSLRFVVEVR